MLNIIKALFKNKPSAEPIKTLSKKTIKSQNLKIGDKITKNNSSDFRVGRFVSIKDSEVLEVVGAPYIKRNRNSCSSVLVPVKVLSAQPYHTQARFNLNYQVELETN